MLIIRGYQLLISPLLGKSCRFYPTCSEYAHHALQTHGYKGLWYIIIRILKCGPWHPGGIDFVPNHPSSQEFVTFDPNVDDHGSTDSHP